MNVLLTTNTFIWMPLFDWVQIYNIYILCIYVHSNPIPFVCHHPLAASITFRISNWAMRRKRLLFPHSHVFIQRIWSDFLFLVVFIHKFSVCYNFVVAVVVALVCSIVTHDLWPALTLQWKICTWIRIRCCCWCCWYDCCNMSVTALPVDYDGWLAQFAFFSECAAVISPLCMAQIGFWVPHHDACRQCINPLLIALCYIWSNELSLLNCETKKSAFSRLNWWRHEDVWFPSTFNSVQR